MTATGSDTTCKSCGRAVLWAMDTSRKAWVQLERIDSRDVFTTRSAPGETPYAVPFVPSIPGGGVAVMHALFCPGDPLKLLGELQSKRDKLGRCEL